MDQGAVAERVAVDEGSGPAARSGCPVDHGGVGRAPAAERAAALVVPATNVEVASAGAVGERCPFPHHVGPQPSTSPDGLHRSRADRIARSVLRIRERPAGVSARAAYSAFQRSMMISAARCTLTYIVFPFVVPAIGFATGVGPIIGIVIGIVAMTCDVFTIRRFFAIDHKWRWYVAGVACSVIGLLSVLMVQDIVHLVT